MHCGNTSRLHTRFDQTVASKADWWVGLKVASFAAKMVDQKVGR